ncbi:hypothetical protein VTI74DRAFT_4671 [Chaetomium olivicolor]
MAWSDASYNYYSTSDYSDILLDEHRCRVEGCRRKQAYVRTRDGRKNYSRYCINHTCRRIYPDANFEAFHCPTPKHEADRYCPEHLRCVEPGCTREGEWPGVREYIPWYCTKHRCGAPDCRSRATDTQQQRCAAHFMRCCVPDCTRPCHLHRDGRLDIVCAVHYGTFKCAWAGCSRRTGYNTRYCPAHKCVVRDCTASRDPAGDRDACLEHLCRTPSCPNPTAYPSLSTSLHCTAHSCSTPSCPNPRHAASGSDFCLTHTCATPSCRGEALSNSAHCLRHACIVPTCANPRLSAVASSTLGVGLDRDKCAEHASAPLSSTRLNRERRSASLDLDVDFDSLRNRFVLGAGREEQRLERERKRLSDDLEGLRRQNERELERARRARRDREELEKLQRDMEDWRRRYPAWDDGYF